MWQIIPSLNALVQGLAEAFTQPSFQTLIAILLGWVMYTGKRTEYRVFEMIQADIPVSRAERHPFDRFYNFFSRSAWKIEDLAHALCVAIVVALNPSGVLYLVVDDTLLHKRGVHVYGLGWFRDAVASTAKRVATASGNNWVVIGLAIPIPRMPDRIICLPLLARLHLPGKKQPSCVDLAATMLGGILKWYPDRQFVLTGDGAYAAHGLLADLDARVTFVGRMRADAAIYDPQPRPRRPGQRGPKPKKGPRWPSPEQAAEKADRQRSGKGPWVWQTVDVLAYGVTRTLQVLSYQAVWPEVLRLRPILIVIVRDPEGQFRDTYLFTTNLTAGVAWVIATYASRWSIEVSFKSSKQVMGIEAPQHWCQSSIEKLAPWVWLMQSLVILWYLTVGHRLPEAKVARTHMGPWDSEWSLRHMLKVLRSATLEATINVKSAQKGDLLKLITQLKNCVKLAA
jgi:hypothetical protein